MPDFPHRRQLSCCRFRALVLRRENWCQTGFPAPTFNQIHCCIAFTATGSGFSPPVGLLAPGAQQQIPFQSNSGSFRLEFDASGRHFSNASPADPWNGMKEIIMTITNNFGVDCASVTTFLGASASFTRVGDIYPDASPLCLLSVLAFKSFKAGFPAAPALCQAPNFLSSLSLPCS